MKRALESTSAVAEQSTGDGDGVREPRQFGAYLTAAEARVYVGCATMQGWYRWRRRHAIPSGRTFLKVDLDRAIKAMRRHRRRMSPNSLRNLRQSA
jgi:hypothetical protein